MTKTLDFALSVTKLKIANTFTDQFELDKFIAESGQLTADNIGQTLFIADFSRGFSEPIPPHVVEIELEENPLVPYILNCLDSTGVDETIYDQFVEYLANLDPEDPKWAKKAKRGLKRILKPLPKPIKKSIKRQVFGKKFTGTINMGRIVRKLKRKIRKGKLDQLYSALEEGTDPCFELVTQQMVNDLLSQIELDQSGTGTEYFSSTHVLAILLNIGNLPKFFPRIGLKIDVKRIGLKSSTLL